MLQSGTGAVQAKTYCRIIIRLHLLKHLGFQIIRASKFKSFEMSGSK